MRHWSIFSVAIVSVWVGCKDPETVQSYRIEKSKSGLSDFDDPAGDPPSRQAVTSANSENQGQDRMVVGIANRPDATWYFKIVGPVDRVTSSQPLWMGFLEKIRFGNDGKPVWDLPQGWTVGGPAPMRFATLIMDSTQPPLEIRISSLGPDQDSLSNVNRWRRQLQLPAIAESELALQTIENVDGNMDLFDASGSMGNSAMVPPFAGQAAQQPLVQKSPVQSVKHDAPTGWDLGRTSSIVKARLRKVEGEKSAMISVTDLPASANRWAPNVKRWADEVGLEESVDSLAAGTEEVTVDGMTGNRIRLVNMKDRERNATIGVMVVRGDSAWFFKLTGSRDLVIASEKDFDEFLKSFRFESNRP